MKKVMLVLLVVLAATAVAMAGGIPLAPQSSADTLGAHLGYGRGCIMCHAPHSGAHGNNVSSTDPTTGNYILWGQDLTPLYGQTLNFAGARPVTLPATFTPVPPTAGPYTGGQNGTLSNSDAATIVLLCLSCHDGNLAKVGMMTGTTVETLPIVGGKAPTFLGNDGTTAGNYINDHPVGPSAVVACGGQYNWDCTGSNTVKITATTMNGTNSSKFLLNYGFAVSLASSGTTINVVTCTSCHNQHFETVYTGTMGGVAGSYQTMFFLRGYYNPSTGGNNAAQFCRQCHGGNSNEMAGQLSVPTT